MGVAARILFLSVALSLPALAQAQGHTKCRQTVQSGDASVRNIVDLVIGETTGIEVTWDRETVAKKRLDARFVEFGASSDELEKAGFDNLAQFYASNVFVHYFDEAGTRQGSRETIDYDAEQINWSRGEARWHAPSAVPEYMQHEAAKFVATVDRALDEGRAKKLRDIGVAYIGIEIMDNSDGKAKDSALTWVDVVDVPERLAPYDPTRNLAQTAMREGWVYTHTPEGDTLIKTRSGVEIITAADKAAAPKASRTFRVRAVYTSEGEFLAPSADEIRSGVDQLIMPKMEIPGAKEVSFEEFGKLTSVIQ